MTSDPFDAESGGVGTNGIEVAALAESSARPSPIRSLTGLRFVAAAIVLIEHFPAMLPWVDAEALAQGGAGVGLFFVLSGFVLVYNYADWFFDGFARGRPFWRARFARIYPLHVIALVLITIILVVQNDEITDQSSGVIVISWIANLLLLHAWVPSVVFHSWNGPSWSISDELFFYAAFPFFVRYVAWPVVKRRTVGLLLVGMYAISLFLFVAMSLFIARQSLSRGTDPVGTRLLLNRVVYFPPLRIWEFFIGCLLGMSFLRSQRTGVKGTAERRILGDRRWRNILVGIAIAGAVAVQFLPDCLQSACWPDAQSAAAMLDFKTYVVYVPLAALLIAALAWGPSLLSSILEHPVLVLLGEASYAVYILQWPVARLINAPGLPPPGWITSWLAVIATIAVGVVAHLVVENPLRRRLRGPAGPRTASATKPLNSTEVH
jgi:peptidoglycan/LPS O-acetylase OafA/YrhL